MATTFGDPSYHLVDSGQTVSAPFFVGGGPDRLTILTPSRTPGAPVFCSVAPTSGGPFGRIQTETGSDMILAVSGQAIVAGFVHTMAPGRWARVEVGVATTGVNTFTIVGAA